MLSLHSEFHAKCGGLPINLSIIFPACTVDGAGRRELHSHFQIGRDVSGYTIRKSEGSRTPDGSIRVAYQVLYKDVNEKLLHLSHLLSIGSPRDTYRRGVLQEEDDTLFNAAQSEARRGGDTLNNHDKKLDFVSCSVPVELLLPLTPLRSKRKALNWEAGKKQSCGYFASAD